MSATANGHHVPSALLARPHWCLWRQEDRDGRGPTKIPYQPSGARAKSSDPSTWGDYESRLAALEKSWSDAYAWHRARSSAPAFQQYSGVGYCFAPDDGLCGIDLDGCRDPETGDIAQWAQEIIDTAQTYCEISPSGTGVKLYGLGRLPNGKGKKVSVEAAAVCSKAPAVEAYDRGRYFAYTGLHLESTPGELQDCQSAIDLIAERYWQKAAPTAKPTGKPAPANGKPMDLSAIQRRARAYLAKVPPAVSGQGGHNATYHAACVLVQGFSLSVDDALPLMLEWNATCQPPWLEHELLHKLEDALDEPGPRGELLAQGNGSTGTSREHGDGAVPGSEPPYWVGTVLSSEEFDNATYDQRFLVQDILAAGQPCIAGGRSKTLKTSITIDLALSLGSGTPFLGKFPAEKCNVAIFSGESGAATIQGTARRIARQREIRLRECSVWWSFSLPALSYIDHVEALGAFIDDKKLSVAIVDPLYLALLSADTAGLASNIFGMGAVLLPLSQVSQATGCTIILLHHFRKSSNAEPDEPASLEELAMSGAAEWARQWMLLQRRSPYQHDGHHSLWMRAGGSAGHAGLYGLEIDEGTLDSGRRWEVQVEDVRDVRDQVRREKDDRRARDMERRDEEHVERLLISLRNFSSAETEKTLRTNARLNPDNFSRAMQTLIRDGRVEEIEVVKRGQKRDAYRLKV